MKILCYLLFFLFSNAILAQNDPFNIIKPNENIVECDGLYTNYSFKYQNEVESLINRITAVSSDYLNFNVKECTQLTTGCLATKDSKTDLWYLFYTDKFVETLIDVDTLAIQIDTNKWENYIRFIHEVAIIIKSQNIAASNIELEVAQYIGLTCGRLGASLSQILPVYDSMGLDKTYKESRDSRVEQLIKGWENSQTPPLNGDRKVFEELSQVDVLMVNENFSAAFPILTKYQNHPLFEPRFMNYLGLIFANKRGEKDLSKAIPWYEKAAERGLVRSMSNLAIVLGNSPDSTKNLEKSFHWAKKAAKAGHKYGFYRTGWHYLKGSPLNRDTIEAMKWFNSGAKKGSSIAMDQLGYSYLKGIVLPKNHSKAIFWFEQAAINGSAYSMNHLGLCHEYERGTSKNLKKAKFWYEAAARLDNADAMCNLGLCHEYGKGTSKNLKKAKFWYAKAAQVGNTRAMKQLVQLIYTSRENLQAKDKLVNAADKGSVDSIHNLGIMYEFNESIKDFQKAGFWDEEAVRMGNSTAMYSLGRCYEFGRGTSKDVQKAKFWYEKSAQAGNVRGMERLGQILYTYAPRNISQAEKWLLKAAEKGSISASRSLGYFYQTYIYKPDKAFFWAEKTNSKKDSRAMGYLATLYLTGNTPKGKDIKKAEVLAGQAIKENQKSGMFAKGLHCYLVEKKYKKSFFWLSKSDVNDFRVLHLLGYMYLQGIGVKKDYQLALKYFKFAADISEISVLESLNRLGINVEKD